MGKSTYMASQMSSSACSLNENATPQNRNLSPSVVKMPRRCGVPSCSTQAGDGHILHTLPVYDKKLSQKWMECIGCAGEAITPYFHVCSRHFSEDCYTVLNNRKTLDKQRLPTLNLGLSKSDLNDRTPVLGRIEELLDDSSSDSSIISIAQEQKSSFTDKIGPAFSPVVRCPRLSSKHNFIDLSEASDSNTADASNVSIEKPDPPLDADQLSNTCSELESSQKIKEQLEEIDSTEKNENEPEGDDKPLETFPSCPVTPVNDRLGLRALNVLDDICLKGDFMSEQKLAKQKLKFIYERFLFEEAKLYMCKQVRLKKLRSHVALSNKALEKPSRPLSVPLPESNTPKTDCVNIEKSNETKNQFLSINFLKNILNQLDNRKIQVSPNQFDFVPCPTVEFLYLIGLEECVQRQIKKHRRKVYYNPFSCEICGTYFTPSWRKIDDYENDVDDDDSDESMEVDSEIVCERCVRKQNLRILRQENKKLLSTIFTEALAEEKNREASSIKRNSELFVDKLSGSSTLNDVLLPVV